MDDPGSSRWTPNIISSVLVRGNRGRCGYRRRPRDPVKQDAGLLAWKKVGGGGVGDGDTARERQVLQGASQERVRSC